MIINFINITIVYFLWYLIMVMTIKLYANSKEKFHINVHDNTCPALFHILSLSLVTTSKVWQYNFIKTKHIIKEGVASLYSLG